MGCGATKIQSHVTLPNSQVNVKSSVETSSVQQSDANNHSTTEEAVAPPADEHQQSIVEVTNDIEQEKQVTTTRSYQSSTEKQQVNDQQEIPRVGSVKQLQVMKSDSTIIGQETADKKQTVNQDFSDNELSKTFNEDNSKDTVPGVVDMQTDTCEQNYTETSLSSYNKELLTNPLQYHSTARSLSQSPRIVSLQVELGFVSIKSTDLDVLQSKL